MNGLPRVIAKGEGGFDHLKGVVVLDLTTSIAGPYATMLLADFGARVIKIERPGRGDDARGWGPPFLDEESLWFLAVNRNKESVTLDYTSDAGRSIFEKLVVKADVVISNQPPNVQCKLRTDFASLSALNETLIYTSITGFGLTGTRSDWTCYDLIAEGYSGVMDITGAAESAPQKIGTPAADMLAGQDAAMAIMAALLRRSSCSVPQLLDIALVESMSRFLACRSVPYLGSGEVPRRSGGTDSVIAIYQAFETADYPITLGLGTDGIWERFWNALDAPDYARRLRFATNKDRRRCRSEIVADIQAILKTKSRDRWLALFASRRVPAGPINTVADVASDTALHERGLFYVLDDGERAVPQVGLGIHCDGRTANDGMLPPRLGADTEDVLSEELMLSQEEIAELRKSGTI